MRIHNLVQGSPEWQQFRLEHFGASEAAAMLGISPKVKRTELLHMKHTGTPKEFSDWVQANILDYGHEVEALARPIIEEIIGDDLYPVTCSDGKYSASCDGLTMSEEIAFEHKQWNEEYAAMVSAGIVPEEHMPQCQQILMVTGASKLIFVMSDGTRERMVYTEVTPDKAWFERLVAGWEQFAKDLAEYKPREIPEKPKAEAIMQLPALAVQIRGEVVTSNLPAFKAAAEQFIANIKTDLQTDEDFVNAEATAKFCDEAEKKLTLAKEAALAQTASVDELLRTIDHIKDQLRDKRLMLDKLVTNKKKEIKEEILLDARNAYAEHVQGLEAETKPIRLNIQPGPDFITAAKNKRTLASLHDAVDSELARAKIAADAVAKDVRAKLAWCKTNADGYGFLFNDLQQVIQKPMDDFQMLVTSRIAQHKQAEEAKLEAERKRIQEEERIRAEAKARADQEAEQERLRQQQADIDRQQAVLAAAQARRQQEEAEATIQHQQAELVSDATPHVNVIPMSQRPPALRLGQINERLGFTVTADFLTGLGFPPAATDKSAKLYHDADFAKICAAIAQHTVAAGRQFAAQLAA